MSMTSEDFLGIDFRRGGAMLRLYGMTAKTFLFDD
jgi:hypothetical protein